MSINTLVKKLNGAIKTGVLSEIEDALKKCSESEQLTLILATPDLGDINFLTPVEYAILSGNIKIVELLDKVGARFHEPNKKSGYYPIHWVMYCKNIEQEPLLDYFLTRRKKFLLDNTPMDIDFNVRDSQGRTIAHLAVVRNAWPDLLVNLHKKYGVDFTKGDKNGDTPCAYIDKVKQADLAQIVKDLQLPLKDPRFSKVEISDRTITKVGEAEQVKKQVISLCEQTEVIDPNGKKTTIRILNPHAFQRGLAREGIIPTEKKPLLGQITDPNLITLQTSFQKGLSIPFRSQMKKVQNIAELKAFYEKIELEKEETSNLNSKQKVMVDELKRYIETLPKPQLETPSIGKK